jgi:CMP-N,N'-diacetyllegionaminic acid synthase
MKTVAIILARGGSKGIPKKNIIDFCGKPLLAWTIEHCLDGGVDSIYVSSDSDEILEVGEKYGAQSIRRPKDISVDLATSESGWLHALKIIESESEIVNWVLAPQVTSPIRTSTDISEAIKIAEKGQFDSIFSAIEVEDFFMWVNDPVEGLKSLNYDYNKRKRRQQIKKRYLENGSFYLFRTNILKNNANRLGGKICPFVMEKYKMFQIDNFEDLTLAKIIMHGYGLV